MGLSLHRGYMILKPLKTSNVDEPQASRYFDRIKEFLDQIMRTEFLAGSSISTTIGTSNTEIPHGLDVIPNGFLIVDKTANSNIWRVSWNKKTITLIASSSVDVKLWIF